MPAACQFDGDRGSKRRLAHAALAHEHDEAVSVRGEVVHHAAESRHDRSVSCPRLAAACVGRAGSEQRAQLVDADQVERLQRQAVGGQRAQGFRHGLRAQPVRVERPRPRAGRWPPRRPRQDAVDHQRLAAEPDGREFIARARHFAQCRGLRTCNQYQSRARRIGERCDRRLVLAALLLQAGQRAQAGGVSLASLEEAGPGAGQLQQANRVARRCRIEQDVIVVARQRRVGQERRELIERGDLRRAGT